MSWRPRIVEASMAPWPRAPWEQAPPSAATVLAWQAACLFRALEVPGLVVEGRGARLTVALGTRRTALDLATTTWFADGVPVRWRAGTEREHDTYADVMAWLVDGVEPTQPAAEPKGSEAFWGAVHPLDRKAS